ncbi:hypothetical protein ATCC90586_008183 [Pythium insidiosum]|nr:hypothetical protein ATCC90586_008183 [Pythium insidiosum]
MLGGDESDEETKILRALNVTGNIESLELSSDDEDEDSGRRVAKRELHAVLSEVQTTQRAGPATDGATRKRVTKEEIHAMKLRAVALKRDGKIREALALFREIKSLEAQPEISEPAAATNQSVSVVASARPSLDAAASMEYGGADEQDVEVTDEDMQNPEYLAQLASLGLAMDRPQASMPTISISALEDEIKSTKLKAVGLKRAGQIADALAELRKVKELEAKLRKAYAADLDKLRTMRKVPGQDPPPFHIETLQEQVEVERLEIPEDEVHVSINSISGLQSVAGKEVFVKFNLAFPAGSPHEGKTRDEEAEDPHDLNLIISYDVINEEMEKIQGKLPMLSGAAARDLGDRFDSLALKKQLLEIEIETGKLTQEMYTARLHQRIGEDRALIARLLKTGRRPDAARVLHRVKIMEKELASATDESA